MNQIVIIDKQRAMIMIGLYTMLMGILLAMTEKHRNAGLLTAQVGAAIMFMYFD